MRLDLRNVPSGVATMSDRVLPNIFPTGDEQLFTAALAETVGVERPPPKGFEDRATTFAALDTFAGDNFFSSGIKRRVVVLLTDGETAPYFGGDLRESLRLPPHVRFVIVRMGGQGERIWVNGRLDPRYRPDSSAPARPPPSLRSSTAARTGRARLPRQPQRPSDSSAPDRSKGSATGCARSRSPRGSPWRLCSRSSSSSGRENAIR